MDNEFNHMLFCRQLAFFKDRKLFCSFERLLIIAKSWNKHIWFTSKIDMICVWVEIQWKGFDKYIRLQDRKCKLLSVWIEPCWCLVLFFSVSQLQQLDMNLESPSSLRCSAGDLNMKKYLKCIPGQRHDNVWSANAKASSNQRHALHQQHPWGLRVQTNGK